MKLTLDIREEAEEEKNHRNIPVISKLTGKRKVNGQIFGEIS